MLCSFPYEVFCNGNIVTFFTSYNCYSVKKFEHLNNNFNLQFDLFPLQHHHFIGDLVITNHFCNYGKIDFSLVKLLKLGEAYFFTQLAFRLSMDQIISCIHPTKLINSISFGMIFLFNSLTHCYFGATLPLLPSKSCFILTIFSLYKLNFWFQSNW